MQQVKIELNPKISNVLTNILPTNEVNALKEQFSNLLKLEDVKQILIDISGVLEGARDVDLLELAVQSDSIHDLTENRELNLLQKIVHGIAQKLFGKSTKFIALVTKFDHDIDYSKLLNKLTTYFNETTSHSYGLGEKYLFKLATRFATIAIDKRKVAVTTHLLSAVPEYQTIESALPANYAFNANYVIRIIPIPKFDVDKLAKLRANIIRLITLLNIYRNDTLVVVTAFGKYVELLKPTPIGKLPSKVSIQIPNKLAHQFAVTDRGNIFVTDAHVAKYHLTNIVYLQDTIVNRSLDKWQIEFDLNPLFYTAGTGDLRIVPYLDVSEFSRRFAEAVVKEAEIERLLAKSTNKLLKQAKELAKSKSRANQSKLQAFTQQIGKLFGKLLDRSAEYIRSNNQLFAEYVLNRLNLVLLVSIDEYKQVLNDLGKTIANVLVKHNKHESLYQSIATDVIRTIANESRTKEPTDRTIEQIISETIKSRLRSKIVTAIQSGLNSQFKRLVTFTLGSESPYPQFQFTKNNTTSDSNDTEEHAENDTRVELLADVANVEDLFIDVEGAKVVYVDTLISQRDVQLRELFKQLTQHEPTVITNRNAFLTRLLDLKLTKLPEDLSEKVVSDLISTVASFYQAIGLSDYSWFRSYQQSPNYQLLAIRYNKAKLDNLIKDESVLLQIAEQDWFPAYRIASQLKQYPNILEQIGSVFTDEVIVDIVLAKLLTGYSWIEFLNVKLKGLNSNYFEPLFSI